MYENIENVKGIYYQDHSRNYGATDYLKQYLFRQGIKFIEMDVDEIAKASIAKDKGLNRFWINENGELKAKKIRDSKSDIIVRTTHSSLKLVPIDLYETRIFTQEGKILSKRRGLLISYLSILYIPYFNWIHWYDQGLVKFRCFPKKDILKLTVNP